LELLSLGAARVRGQAWGRSGAQRDDPRAAADRLRSRHEARDRRTEGHEVRSQEPPERVPLGKATDSARRPCLRALRLARAFLASDRGPVERSEYLRLIARRSSAMSVMDAQLRVSGQGMGTREASYYCSLSCREAESSCRSAIDLQVTSGWLCWRQPQIDRPPSPGRPSCLSRLIFWGR
jgi:hypothetical protein